MTLFPINSKGRFILISPMRFTLLRNSRRFCWYFLSRSSAMNILTAEGCSAKLMTFIIVMFFVSVGKVTHFSLSAADFSAEFANCGLQKS